MSRRPRRNHAAAFKAWVALEAIRGEKTVAQIAAHRRTPGQPHRYLVTSPHAGTASGKHPLPLNRRDPTHKTVKRQRQLGHPLLPLVDLTLVPLNHAF